MENSPPETFVAFLLAILEAETHADLWKSKLFYFSPQQIVAFIQSHHKNSFDNDESFIQAKQATVSIESLVSFIQKSLKHEEIDHSMDNQKVISKYFSFNQNTICSTSAFLKRLQPTNNKLILNIQKQNLNLQHSLSGLFLSILSGYAKIKQRRQQCAQNIHSILSYFHSQMAYYKGLTKQTLKEITFEANIYGRINFSYLKQYIFGDDQEIIGWETLFGVKVNQGIQKIEELSEENIVSEHFIKPYKSRAYSSAENEIQQCPSEINRNRESFYIESVSQIKNISEPASVAKILSPDGDYTKVLNEINHIETLLNKTKQRYQKNRQDLQNQTHIIKCQQLKRSYNLGKFSSGHKNAEKYESLKIYESQTQVTSPKDPSQETQKNQLSNISLWQRSSQIKKVEPRYQSPYKALKATQPMEESIIRPFITRQEMRKEINQTIHQQANSSITSVQSTSRQREAGRIMRRSVSKDAERIQHTSSQQRCSQNKTNYSEYEAVLIEIKRQESKYKRMVEDREKILYDREIRTIPEVKSTINMHRKTPSYGSLTCEFTTTKPKVQRQSKTYTLQRSPSNSRYSNIMKEMQPNCALSRSRVSSKKREEIVQKATSQARLRIQEIQNRALKRIGKLDTDIYDKNPLKHSSYLKLQQTELMKNDTPKYKPMKENTPAIIRSQKSPQTKNFFINDLLNERPNLKLSMSSTSYQSKY